MYRFFSDCVSWPHNAFRPGGLSDMVDEARDITRRTFLSKVDRQELRDIESRLGYAAHPKAGLTMSRDWVVRYYKSKLYGKTVYFFDHSAIEYVFQ